MRAPAVLEDCVIALSAADVIKTFKPVNIGKAAGPGQTDYQDVYCGHALTNRKVSSITF